MKKYLLLLLFLLSLNANAEELYLDHITYSWDTGCQYYTLYSDADLPMYDPGIDYYTPVYGEIKYGVWEIEKKQVNLIDTPVYKQVCNQVSDNKTGSVQVCVPGELVEYKTTPITEVRYDSDFKTETIRAYSPRMIRFCAEFTRQYVKDRGWVIEVDVVPNYAGKSYTSLAWFNNTYTQKVDLINDTYNLTAWVNGTAGCNGTRYLTRNLNGGNLSQYQISCTDFAIVSNDLTGMPFETENTGYNNTPTNLYLDAWYVNHFGFNESGNSSFNSVLQAYDSEYYVRQNLTTGLVGQGLQTDGASGIFVKNSTNTQYPLDMYGAWGIFACVKPYNSTQWTTAKTHGDLFWFKSATNCALYLDVSNNANNYAFECSGYSNPIAFNDMSYQFYCFTTTCDGTNCNLYLNTTRSSTFAYLNDEFKISNFNIGLRRQSEGAIIDQKLNGAVIDEFMFFKRNLTQNDVNHLVKSYLGNSEYKYSGINEYPTYPNVYIKSIGGQGNNTNITDTTPEIIFNVSGEKSTFNCSAVVNNTVKGSNTSVVNNTDTSINTSALDLGGSYFNITCTGSLTNTSEQWYMTILTTTTTTTTSTTTPGATTTTTVPCTGQYNLSYFGNRQLCVKNITAGETCLNSSQKYEYNCSQDYILTLKLSRQNNTVKEVFTADLPNIVYMIGFTLILLMIVFWVIWSVIF